MTSYVEVPSCDMIYDDGNGGLVRCAKPAVAVTLRPISPRGHVRYCRACLKMIKSWGVKTVPITERLQHP